MLMPGNDYITSQILLSQSWLFRLAYNLTLDLDDAKDLLQETSLKALVSKEMYRESGNIKNWLCTIMFNLFVNCHRSASRRQSLSIDFQIPEDETFCEIDTECSFSATDIERIMSLLPPDSRTLFELYLQGYHYDEIARNQGLPLGTVKTRIFRIKQELRAYKKQIV